MWINYNFSIGELTSELLLWNTKWIIWFEMLNKNVKTLMSPRSSELFRWTKLGFKTVYSNHKIRNSCCIKHWLLSSIWIHALFFKEVLNIIGRMSSFHIYAYQTADGSKEIAIFQPTNYIYIVFNVAFLPNQLLIIIAEIDKIIWTGRVI